MALDQKRLVAAIAATTSTAAIRRPATVAVGAAAGAFTRRVAIAAIDGLIETRLERYFGRLPTG